MRKWMWIFLALLCTAAVVLSAAMCVSAFMFMEYGRFVFYMSASLIALSIDLAILSNLKKS